MKHQIKSEGLAVCYECGAEPQMPCDENANKCPFAIAAYLIQTRDDDLCDYISQYLEANP